MASFDPYEHLLRNFSKSKFKAFIEDSIFNLNSYFDYVPIQAEESWVNKEDWDKRDFAWMDMPNLDALREVTSFNRWFFHLDHLEDGLIKPELIWDRIGARAKQWARTLVADEDRLRELRDALYDTIGRVVDYSTHRRHYPTYGAAILYYVTNAPVDPRQSEWAEGLLDLSKTIRSVFVEGARDFQVDVNKAQFAVGIGSPSTFIAGDRERAITVIQKLEARPDSLHLQFVEGRIRATPVNQRHLYVYDHSDPKVILLDQSAPALATSDLIGELEALLNKKGLRESHLQEFLEAHPAFLLGLDYDEIKPQVTLNDESGTILRPDFLLRPTGRRYWDILDIKLPHVSLVTDQRNRQRLSGWVQEGISQLMNYARFFDDASNREKVKRATGIDCLNPRLTLVIGQKRNVDEKTWNQVINQQRPQVEIVGFDELLDRTKKACALWQSLHV